MPLNFEMKYLFIDFTTKDCLTDLLDEEHIVLYCIVLYCIMRPYTDGPIGPLSYRHSSGVVRNPHSTLAK